jgi:iron complex transport system permease protein
LSRKRIAGLGAAAVVVGTLSLTVRLGAEPVSVVRAIAEPESLDRTILLDIRRPRVALGGAGLAMVGAAFQGLLKNPLAEPFLLGISGGTALGASVAIAAGLGGVILHRGL